MPAFGMLLLFTDEIGPSPLRHIGSELQRVPIRQTYASVGLRLTDFARFWSAMNTVALPRETNPHEPNRIVGTRLDRKWFIGPHSFEGVGGVIMVRRIFLYSRYLQRAGWSWLLLTSNGRRIVS